MDFSLFFFFFLLKINDNLCYRAFNTKLTAFTTGDSAIVTNYKALQFL